jgi:zinc/manganese transport system ATP-binding protein
LVVSTQPAVEMRGAGLAFGGRALWQNIDVTIAAGEFVAVLGPNGSGKTSLVKVLLGLVELTTGSVRVWGAPPKRGSSVIGYIPQQRGFDRDVPVRGVDLVRFGLDGHRWGIPLPDADRRRKVDAAVAAVGATAFAQLPSLDLKSQRDVVTLIDAQRRASDIAVLFVTHDINPILPVVDRVLYLVGTRWAMGTQAEVLTSATLSELYQTRVDVVEVGGRIVIVGVPDSPHADPGSTHYHHVPAAEVIDR